MTYTSNFYLGNNNSGQLLLNNCSYIIIEDQIQINIDKICNNREIFNLSGSLSIELWALAESYDGKSFSNAYCMANIMIGEIFGQHFLENCQYNMSFRNPPSGNWQLCLMLREFNGEVYETVDYCNFTIPYIIDSKSDISPNINNSLESKDTIYKSEDKRNEKKVVNDNKIVVKVTKVIEKINLNTASEEEIAKIKGISGKLANLILNSRPFESSNDLIKLKGIGKKLLTTILEQSEI